MAMIYNNKFATDPFGLVNSNSICYSNSFLQALLGCSAFNEILLTNEKKPNYAKNSLVKTYISLLKLAIKNPKSAQIPNKSIEIMTQVRSILSKKGHRFATTSGQQDKNEFFYMFMECLSEFPEINLLFTHRYYMGIICEKYKKYSVLRKDVGTVLHIPADVKDVSKYIRYHERTIEDFKCSKCDVRSDKRQINVLKMVPDILIILAKKFQNKPNTPFPEVLKFNGVDNKPITYKAVSTVEHLGASGGKNFRKTGGHYITHSLRKDNKWYKFDDLGFHESKFTVNINTYVVMYHKK